MDISKELIGIAKELTSATRMPRPVRRWYETFKKEGIPEKKALKDAIQRAYENDDITEKQADNLEKRFKVAIEFDSPQIKKNPDAILVSREMASAMSARKWKQFIESFNNTIFQGRKKGWYHFEAPTSTAKHLHRQAQQLYKGNDVDMETIKRKNVDGIAVGEYRIKAIPLSVRPKSSNEIASELLKMAKSLVSREKTLYGKDARIIVNEMRGLIIEELPQKGKNKLRRFELSLAPALWGNYNANSMIMDNVFRISSSSTYDKLKKEITDGYKKALVEFNKDNGSDFKPNTGFPYYVDEDSVHYLKVEPRDANPFRVQARDFEVDVSWTTFKAYSPESDLQGHTPHYTIIEAKSAAAGRKMYKILKSNPNALKSVSWSKFDSWLGKNKVPYDIRFSQWS